MYSIIKCYKDISSFKEVLEYIPVQLDKEIKYQQIDDNNELVNCLRKYILENKRDKYIVSLSGGVDSMVIATILSYLQCKVVAIHINYNNRVETKKEVSGSGVLTLITFSFKARFVVINKRAVGLSSIEKTSDLKRSMFVSNPGTEPSPFVFGK